MICQKTGCVAYLFEYQCWVRGDSFVTEDGSLVIRVSSRHHASPGPVNYEVHRIDYWFDNVDGRAAPSTLIVGSKGYRYFGYDGQRKPADLVSSRPTIEPIPEGRIVISGKQHSLHPIPLSEMQIKLAGIPDEGLSEDGKVTHRWQFLADGRECAIWDYYGTRWSGYGPASVFERLGLL